MRKLVIFLVLLMSTSAASAQETPNIASPPSPPGTLIDVGGYRLHLYCLGNGSPTVILEPGFARFSLNWRATQVQLAVATRVCAYDHAGLGWSEPGPMPRTTQHLSDELALLLQNSDEQPPYVLVAHSLGGFVARMFAAQHSEDVAGVVLLDATPPEFLLDPMNEQSNQFLETIIGGTLQVAQAGEWNQQALLPILQLTDDVPEDLRPTFISLATQPHFLETALSEWTNRTGNAQQVIDAGAMGDLALAVVVAGKRLELASDADSLWIQGQVAQAQLSTTSELCFVVGSDHNFYETHPDVVLQTVRRLIDDP